MPLSVLAPAHPYFAQALLEWYPRHRRDLPWRHTRNPYAIWLSEVILQQTRVKQGLPYYLDFITTYPTVQDLAAAPEDEVLRHWQGLGYYSRARNMHHTAQQVVREYEGVFPDTYLDLLKLRGVGQYTAAAIASFAFGEKVAVLDGNVYRVLSRVFGITSDIAAPATRKEFQALADTLIPAAAPDEFNQAIMEFGAIQCTPIKPDCLFCPLQSQCYAFQHGMVQELPVKSKAKAGRTRYFHYIVLRHGDTLYLKKRTAKDIWQGLYDFALTETEAAELPAVELAATVADLGGSIATDRAEEPVLALRHVLSHQKVEARFHPVWLKQPLPAASLAASGLAPFTAEEAHDLPKPVLIANYIDKTWK
ncbi:A/G-specific adenine glycosylase [Hymenobacter cellulosilyticus]|uniref:Adenine DNA glycosylase n=1 Tax=Hymenobacter cellulosilyticus TaxID=2932248 RepID=A0A8T9QA09_9BACT|nr:A/G-specific adenine glycosylase [Hymenobacter cellulosilyticus]UOQ73812.1 A/G-specific adenine glycosylase [Hymenobacter cellulosilyticus]